MDKEREIDEMAKAIACSKCNSKDNCLCRQDCGAFLQANKQAEHLITTMGYGDTKQAVREFAEKAKEGLLCRAICRQDYFQVKADIQTVFGKLLAEVTEE